jgi:hypothetical protein
MIENHKFCVKGYIEKKCDSCEIKHLCNDLHKVLDKMIIESSLEPIVVDRKTMEIKKYEPKNNYVRFLDDNIIGDIKNIYINIDTKEK